MNQIKEIQPTLLRTERLALRISPGEYDKIKAFCQLHGVTFSDFVRQAIRKIDTNLIEGK
jgi:uncharacterized protein (DUF1778 family)